MSVDGGTLLYGVSGEDPSRPDRPAPFDLAGVAERIDQVAQSAIAEPVPLEIRDFPSLQDPTVGYLVVLIPPSPRAPHMVTLERENRYYGRGATGNRILNEGEIARLYARRERWEIDRAAWLESIVAAMPMTYPLELSEVGPMVVATKPVLASDDLVKRSAGSLAVGDYLLRTLQNVARSNDPYPGQGTAGLDRVHALTRKGFNRFVLSYDSDPASRYHARADVHLDGTMTFWHSPVINSHARGPEEQGVVMEQSVTRCLHQHLAAAHAIYEDGGFSGAVDLAMAVLGIESASGATTATNPFNEGPVFGAPDFRRHERLAMTELGSGLEATCRRVLEPLFDVISRAGYDPYENRSPSTPG